MTDITRKPILGLDLDGLVFDYTAGFRRYLGELRGIPEADRLAALPDPVAWSFAESGWFGSEAEFHAAHAAAALAGINADMPVVPGASESLWRLSDAGVHIRIITHRLIAKHGHLRSASDTVAALEAARIPYTDLCFVGDKAGVGADAYAEDAPHNVLALRATGKPVVVMDYAYNRHLPGPRARDWAELERLLAGILLAPEGGASR